MTGKQFKNEVRKRTQTYNLYLTGIITDKEWERFLLNSMSKLKLNK